MYSFTMLRIDRNGVSEIVTKVGEEYDPIKHSAIEVEEVDEDVNNILHVYQKGYMYKDRVLRPAMVKVSK